MAQIANGIYKITSAADSNVIDCSGGGGKKKTKIIAWNYAGAQNQHFQIHNEGVGYRVASLVKSKENMMLVIEHLEKEKGIFLWDFNGGDTQQWVFVPAPRSGGAVLIKNVKTGMCLRNMGHGNQLQPMAESVEDKSQWWLVAPISPPEVTE